MSKSMSAFARNLLVGTALLGLGAAGAQAGEQKAAKNGYYQQKVVYHLNSTDNAKAALNNVKNHLNALGDENVEVVVVTHGDGAMALVDGTKDAKGNTFSDDIAGLANRGVKFQICANTIRGKKIDQNKINEHAEIVPSGVAHVAHLQQQGYLYVKP